MARHWVGTSTSWNDGNNWAASMGGAGGAGVPDSTQDVYFDTGSQSCTLDVNANCKSLASTAGYSGLISFSTYSLTSHNGGIAFDHISNTIKMDVGSSIYCAGTFHIGGLSSAPLIRDLHITANGNIDYDRGHNSNTFGNWTINDGITAVVTGSGRNQLAGQVILGNNSVLTLNVSIIVRRTGGSDIFILGTNSQINGIGNITLNSVNTGGTNIPVGNLNYTGSGFVGMNGQHSYNRFRFQSDAYIAGQLSATASINLYFDSGNTVTLGSFVSTISGRDLDISGNIICNGDFTLSGNENLSGAGTSIINITGTSTFTSNGQTLGTINVNTSGSIMTCADAIDCDRVTIQPNGHLRLKAGTTNTWVSYSAGDIDGTSGNLATLDTDSGGTAATINNPFGMITNYVSYTDITATNDITASLDSGNVDGGGNTLIRFTVDRFWVGTDTSWNTAANWSATSGGAGGAGVPNSYADVYLDNGSAQDCTLDTNADCNSMTVQNNYVGNFSYGGFTFTSHFGDIKFDHTGNLTINGRTSVAGTFHISSSTTISTISKKITFTLDGDFDWDGNGNVINGIELSAGVTVNVTYTGTVCYCENNDGTAVTLGNNSNLNVSDNDFIVRGPNDGAFISVGTGTTITIASGRYFAIRPVTASLNGTIPALTLAGTGAFQVIVDANGQTITHNGAITNTTAELKYDANVAGSTIDINEQSIAGAKLLFNTSYTATVTVDMDNATFTIGGDVTLHANVTYSNVSTSTISVTATSTVTFNGKSLGIFDINSNTDIVDVVDAMNCTRLTGQPDGHLRLKASTTHTWSTYSAGDIDGSGGSLFTIESDSDGTAATIANPSSMSTNYVWWEDITATNAITALYSNGNANAGGNTNINFGVPTVLFWVGTGTDWSTAANWSTFSGGPGGAGVPSSSITVYFDSGSQACTLSAHASCKSLSASSGYSGAFTLNSYNLTSYDGDIDFSHSGTLTTTGGIIYVDGTFRVGGGLSSAPFINDLVFTDDGDLDYDRGHNASTMRNITINDGLTINITGSGRNQFSGSFTVGNNVTLTLNVSIIVRRTGGSDIFILGTNSQINGIGNITLNSVSTGGTNIPVGNLNYTGSGFVGMNGQHSYNRFRFQSDAYIAGQLSATASINLYFDSGNTVTLGSFVSTISGRDLDISGNIICNGDFTLSGNENLSGAGTGSLTLTNNCNLTVAGQTIGAVVMNSVGDTLTMVDTLNCRSMTITNGNLDYNGNDLTTTGGGFSMDGTGNLIADGNNSFAGGFHIGSSVGTVTIDEKIVFTASGNLDTDKAVTIHGIELTDGVNITATSAVVTSINPQLGGDPLTMGDNATFTANANVILERTDAGTFMTIGTGCTLAGSATLICEAEGAACTFGGSGLTITVATLKFDEQSSGNINITSAITSSGGVEFDASIDTQDNDITCAAFTLSGTYTYDLTNITLDCSSFTVGAASTADVDSTTIICTNNFTLNSGMTLNNASNLEVQITSTCAFDNGGKTFGILYAKTTASFITFAAAFTCTNLKADPGAHLRFKNGQTYTWSTFNATDFLGTALNSITIDTDSAGNAANWSNPINMRMYECNIKDINATNEVDAFTSDGNIDLTGNTNFDFIETTPTITYIMYIIGTGEMTIDGNGFEDAQNSGKVETSPTGEGNFTEVDSYNSWSNLQVVCNVTLVSGRGYDVKMINDDGNFTIKTIFIGGGNIYGTLEVGQGKSATRRRIR